MRRMMLHKKRAEKFGVQGKKKDKYNANRASETQALAHVAVPSSSASTLAQLLQ